MKIERYDHLAHRFKSIPLGEAIPLSLTEMFLEQVQLRDKLISDFRTFLLSWDMTIPEHVPDELYERWEREKENLLQSATKTLEGEA